MVGLVLVSHSSQIATGTADLVRQMAGDVEVIPVGGTPDGSLGTDPERIQRAVEEANADEILVFVDIGSAVMCIEAILEMLDDETRAKTHLVDAPFVEGAFAAGVMASTGANADECIEAAIEAKTEPKLG
ncbi:MAG: dihydroxyacetone kinase phosphoryl donor subunit DhaM [Rubrobacter sp.]